MNLKSIAVTGLKMFRWVSLIGKPKIFCISIQRTGTTSVGKFFEEHNFKVATYSVARRNEWTYNWFKGDYQRIFNSLDFKTHQVFEDDPWWCQDFYKVLYHHFPNSKFILFERDPDKWFDSMMNHSGGKTLGNTYRHSKFYRRENEYYQLDRIKHYTKTSDNSLPLTEKNRAHYTDIYKMRIREVKEFFNEFDRERLFYSRLEDPEKWKNLGKYFNIKVEDGYEIHLNKSKRI